MATEVSLSDLEDALMWVSNDGYSCRALVSRATGQIYWTGGDLGDDEEYPEDIEDLDAYAEVPQKNELDLGRVLVLNFASECAPRFYDQISDFFHRKGAYSKFKDLLDRQNLLVQWYGYERAATFKALTAWAEEEGFKVIDDSINPEIKP